MRVNHRAALPICALVVVTAACATAGGERSLPDDAPAASAALEPADSVLLRVAHAAVRIAPALTRAWPGFWSPDDAFIVYRPGVAVLLVSTAAPPAGFLPLADAVLPAALRGRAYLHRGALPGLEGGFHIDYPAGATTATAVAVDPRGIGATLATLFHEAFHGYQARHFAGTPPPGGEFVDAAAIAAPEFRALAELERRMLDAALDVPADSLAERLREYLAVRWLRTRAVPPEVQAVERHLERSEGSAQLVGLTAELLVDGSGADRLPAALRRYLTFPLDSVAGGLAERLIRWRVYGTGAAIGLLLDRSAVPSWRERMERGAHFDELLAMAVAFDSAAAPALAAHALDRFGYADLLADAASAVGRGVVETEADFLALAPARLVVELRVPIEDGTPRMDMNFSAGSAGFAQLEPNLVALPRPEVVTIQVPGGSLVVHGRPVLWDMRGLAAGRMRITVLLQHIPATAGGRRLPHGEHRFDRFAIDADGVRLTIDEPVTVTIGADEVNVRPDNE